MQIYIQFLIIQSWAFRLNSFLPPKPATYDPSGENVPVRQFKQILFRGQHALLPICLEQSPAGRSGRSPDLSIAVLDRKMNGPKVQVYCYISSVRVCPPSSSPPPFFFLSKGEWFRGRLDGTRSGTGTIFWCREVELCHNLTQVYNWRCIYIYLCPGKFQSRMKTNLAPVRTEHNRTF